MIEKIGADSSDHLIPKGPDKETFLPKGPGEEKFQELESIFDRIPKVEIEKDQDSVAWGRIISIPNKPTEDKTPHFERDYDPEATQLIEAWGGSIDEHEIKLGSGKATIILESAQKVEVKLVGPGTIEVFLDIDDRKDDTKFNVTDYVIKAWITIKDGEIIDKKENTEMHI